ncbi:phage portal protein, partial [Escherichia coli]|nr:phage portal protein [Escherichia coli]
GALLRGDMKSRFEAYATGINWGIYSPNDCRDLEDMNPRPGGEEEPVRKYGLFFRILHTPGG